MQGMGWLCLEELQWGDKEHPWVRPGHLQTKVGGCACVCVCAYVQVHVNLWQCVWVGGGVLRPSIASTLTFRPLVLKFHCFNSSTRTHMLHTHTHSHTHTHTHTHIHTHTYTHRAPAHTRSLLPMTSPLTSECRCCKMPPMCELCTPPKPWESRPSIWVPLCSSL